MLTVTHANVFGTKDKQQFAFSFSVYDFDTFPLVQKVAT